MKSFHVKKKRRSGGDLPARTRASAVASSPLLTKKSRVIVEGVAMIKRHTRKSQQHPQGAIVEREGSVHISNVMSATEFDARVAKRGVAPAKA